jgi:hypothetical protein
VLESNQAREIGLSDYLTIIPELHSEACAWVASVAKEAFTEAERKFMSGNWRFKKGSDYTGPPHIGRFRRIWALGSCISP